MTIARRLPIAALVLALSAGNAGICAGWMAVPEARMACCDENGTCAMHETSMEDGGQAHPISQADADRCCAISERGESGPAAPAVTLPAGLSATSGPVSQTLPVPVPLPERAGEPPRGPGAHVARHLLLSVLLV